MNRIAAFTIALLLLSACSNESKILTLEEQVYEFIFNEMMQDAATQIYISNRFEYGIISSETQESLNQTYEQLANFPQTLMADLLSKTNSSEALSWEPLMVNAKLIDSQSDQRESNYYHYVSDVSLNAETMEAVLLIGFSCPALCGAHDTLLFVKKFGLEWKIMAGVRLWVS